MRYKVVCAYDGSNYAGFQSQINAKAIQDMIENVLSKYFNQSIKIIFASRTDAGVHAYGQVFHFDIDKKLDEDCLYHFNQMLPNDIIFKTIDAVTDDFHARCNIKQKHYRYVINIDNLDIFNRNYAYFCPFKLDLELLKAAAKLFIGEHNFEAFNSTPLSMIPDQTKMVDDIKISTSKNYIYLDFYGKSFMRYMIRMMVGMMVEVARGKVAITEITRRLEEPSKDRYHRYSIDGRGLFLVSIEYN